MWKNVRALDLCRRKLKMSDDDFNFASPSPNLDFSYQSSKFCLQVNKFHSGAGCWEQKQSLTPMGVFRSELRGCAKWVLFRVTLPRSWVQLFKCLTWAFLSFFLLFGNKNKKPLKQVVDVNKVVFHLVSNWPFPALGYVWKPKLVVNSPRLKFLMVKPVHPHAQEAEDSSRLILHSLLLIA